MRDKASLYSIEVAMTNEGGEPGLELRFNATEEVIRLKENVPGYEEVESIFIDDVTESVGCFFENLLLLEQNTNQKSE